MNIILFSSDEVAPGGEIRLTEDDSRAQHIIRVLRLQQGARFRAGIIDGPAGEAVLLKTSSNETGELVLRFHLEKTDHPDLLPRLDIIVGSVRPIQLKRLFRDLTSIGVGRIVVAGTQLSEKSYFHSSIWNPPRLKELLTEGAAQGGHTRLPLVNRCESLDDAVREFDENYRAEGEETCVKVRLERGAPGASSIFSGREKTTAMLAIGPERGFTEREIQLLSEAGYKPLGLPSGILRTETAATAAACVIRSWTTLS